MTLPDLPLRTRVKICGITNRADADAAVALGADALGFNTWPGSKRYIDLERESAWLSRVAPLVTKVAVVVNSTLAQVESISALSFIDLIQLHGDESPAFCRALADRGVPFIKAIALENAASVDLLEEFSAGAILVDSFTPRGFGGTGELIDTSLVERLVKRHPHIRLILSGGLRPGNVAALVQRFHPYAVDVASGVESGPGLKDWRSMADFIAATRAASETLKFP